MQTNKLYPLTQTQLGIYSECVKREGENVYNTTTLVYIDGNLDPERLADAVSKALLVHPAFFARIVNDENGTPCMKYVAPEAGEQLCKIVHMEDKWLEEHKYELPTPFDMMNERLFRAKVIVTELHIYLCYEFHHIIFDGTTRQAFSRNIDKAYRGEPLETETVTGFDIAEREWNLRQTEKLTKSRMWYLDEFGDCEGITLPEPDRLSGDEVTYGTYYSRLHLTPQQLTDASKRLQTPASVLTYCAFGRVLSVYSGKKDVCFATIWHGRHDKDIANSAMMMVKTFPVRFRYEDDTIVDESLDRLKHQVWNSRDNDTYSFLELCSETNITGNLLFAYHGNLRECAAVDGCNMTPEQMDANETGVDMAFSVIEMNGELTVKAEYFSNKYSEELIARIVDSFDAVLLRIVNNPREKIKNISIISESQQKELNSFHQVATVELSVKTFHEGIERWAFSTPDATAVTATDRSLTYREYNEAANRMARALMSRGVTKGDRIVLLLPRTSNFLIGLFAVMKCGAAYIPMDPAYPADRISYILDDSEGRYVIATAEHISDYADKAINIDELVKDCESFDSSNLNIEISPHDLAYLIYTSGSTGKPKGVMLEHLGVANFFIVHPANLVTRSSADFASVTLCQTTVSFDLSIFEYGTPLFNGKTVVFANEEETINPFAQAELCKRTGVECISGTPSRIAMNLELNTYEDIMRNQIKSVMMGGEKLPWSLVERLKAMNVKIVNGYGPTETTMGSSGALMNDASFVHIGKPAANYSYRILDSDLNELPVGVMGELAIGGLSLARGYNKLPEKTAAAFIQWNGERLYRTGDYARWTKDGDVIILGRTDNQVKLNGLRIELGEIETVMAKQPGVKQCVVLIKKIAGQDKLVAYYVGKDNDNPDVDDIKAGMAEHLTHYMIPGVFMRLDKMPITPAGKVDVKNLPEPEIIAETKVAPANDQEQTVFDLVAEILGNDDFGVTTNLLSVGMTSLLSIRLSILLKKTFHQGIKVSDIMSKPTVRDITSLIVKSAPADAKSDECPSSLSPYRTNTPFFLTFAQQGVYFDCLKNPDTTIYNIPVLIHLPSSVETEQLRSAITEVLKVHPALFTRIVNLDDEPVMLYPKSIVPEVEVIETTENQLMSVSQDLVQPFELSKGPLYRTKVIKSEVGLYLFLDTHHLVSDGASMNIIFGQIADVLNGKTIEKEECSYFEFADKQRSLYESATFLDRVAFYDEAMKDLKQSAAVPADFQASEIGAQNEVWRTLESLSTHLIDDLDAFCKTNGLTQAQFWYAVTSFVLSRYSDTNDVYMCGISGGRQNLDISNTVGMFVNTLALHSHIDNSTVKEFLLNSAKTFSETMRNEDFPFSDIAANYGFRPLFNYVYQLGLMSDSLVRGEKISMESLDTKIPKFPISVSIEYKENKPSVIAMYDTALYKEESITQLIDDILNTASVFIANPNKEINHIEVKGAESLNRENKFDISQQSTRTSSRATKTDSKDTNEAANELEQCFCDIFAKILGRTKVGANDDFFALGGTSLVAVKVVIEAMNAGYKLDYKTIFDNPTPHLLALTLQPSAAESASADSLPSSGSAKIEPASPYTKILSTNTLDSFRQGKRQKIRGAVVTGATGYLGLHIVKELIDREDKPIIYCMVRSNKAQTALKRLRALLFYYFDDSFDELIGKRLFIVEGDVTKPESFEQLPTKNDGITHLFNCAANVKHFSAGTDIEDINFGGTKNCIEYCLRAGIIMVQTSTYSIAGTSVGDHPVLPHNISERELYWGQTLDNQYVKAKFDAENAVLDAIENRGLNAKIMRLGNLAARSTDGEFQVNFSTNSFMGRLRAFQAVGSIPYEAMSTSIEFSPINEVARAIVLLSETPSENIIFHPVNANTQPYGNVINCLNHLGIDIKMTEQEEFQKALVEAAADESKATILQSMLAYQNVADGKFVVFNGVDYVFTTQVLMRMGFQWSFTTWDYIEKFITAIKGLGFFDEDYER